MIMNSDLDKGKAVTGGVYFGAFLTYATFSVVLVLMSAAISLWWAPGAIGSGVAETMAYMNGVNYVGLLGIPTLIVKSLGVVLAVAGSIKIGKEGPLAHIGSIIGALVLYIPWGFNKKYRNDRDKRMMIAAGAGVGVSVAFGAPIGGVMFAYEVSKANHFWTFGIAWRTFLSTSVANFVLTLLAVGIKDGEVDNVTNSGLLKFASIEKNSYNLGDVIIFAIIGIASGVLGSLYIWVNSSLAKIRKYTLKAKWIKFVEAGVWALLGATVFFFIPLAFSCSSPPEGIESEGTKRYNCENEKDENPMATLMFSTEGETLRFFLTRLSDPKAFNLLISITFFMIWFWGCALEYGIAVPAGLFFPGLLMGGALG